MQSITEYEITLNEMTRRNELIQIDYRQNDSRQMAVDEMKHCHCAECKVQM